jgi:hypothetical protein
LLDRLNGQEELHGIVCQREETKLLVVFFGLSILGINKEADSAGSILSTRMP